MPLKLFGKCKKQTLSDCEETRQTGPPGMVHDGYEVCVLCGRITNLRYDIPITNRRYYGEGCGQLCEECYRKTYVVSAPTPTKRRWMSLVDTCAITVGCQYASDLKHLSKEQRHFLAARLKTLEAREEDLFDWNDALDYLGGHTARKNGCGCQNAAA